MIVVAIFHPIGGLVHTRGSDPLRGHVEVQVLTDHGCLNRTDVSTGVSHICLISYVNGGGIPPIQCQHR